MRTLPITLTTLLALLPACKNDDRRGLPPASEWHQPTESSGGAAAAEDEGESEEQMPDDDTHAGMGDLPADEMHGGGGAAGMPSDEMHGGGGTAAPGHGGAAVADPSRPIDPSKVIAGTIKASAEAQKAIKPGMVLFLSAKPPGTPDCVMKGVMPAASQKPESFQIPYKFRLTEADAQMGGGRLDGEYLICAHLSTTGDAMKKVAGDVFGKAKAKVGQKDIAITLDTVLP